MVMRTSQPKPAATGKHAARDLTDSALKWLKMAEANEFRNVERLQRDVGFEALRLHDEYRALAHEIAMARDAIVKLDDQQLELMEQAEAAQKELAAATRLADEAKKQADRQITDLTAREENLKKELTTLEADRDHLAAAVDTEVLPRYERLRKSKGENVVVGVAHGVCGGCHMKLQRQVIVTCQGSQEIVSCPNCGRILYYTRDMSLAVAE